MITIGHIYIYWFLWIMESRQEVVVGFNVLKECACNIPAMGSCVYALVVHQIIAQRSVHSHHTFRVAISMLGLKHAKTGNDCLLVVL